MEKGAVRIPVVQPDFLIRRFGCDDYFFLVFRMVKLITRPFMDVPFRFVVIHVDADGRFAFGSFVGTMGLEKGGLPLQGFRRCAARVFGEENAFGIYFAGMYFYRFIRQLKDVFYGKFRRGTPAGKTYQERRAQACQEIQGQNEFHQR